LAFAHANGPGRPLLMVASSRTGLDLIESPTFAGRCEMVPRIPASTTLRAGAREGEGALMRAQRASI
jgi:hypothetical protein